MGKLANLASLFPFFGIFGIIFVCMLLSAKQREFQGAVPPQVPLITATGTFSLKDRPHGTLRGGYAVVFRTVDNRTYVIFESVKPDILKKWVDDNPNIGPVYVEGFRLRDGKGSFWPMLITSTDGHVYFSRQQLSKILDFYRNPRYQRDNLVYCIYIGVPFWLMSWFLAYLIRQKSLRMEEQNEQKVANIK